MARPQQVTDDQILRSARAVFLELGPGAPVAKVAERLGVSQAALFQRVGSKERLLRTALAASPPACLDALRAGPVEGRPIRAQLVAILTELARFFDDLVPSLIVLRAANVPLRAPGDAHTGLTGQAPPPVALRALLARWIARARLGIASPRAIAEMLLGALEARCFNRHVGGVAYAPGDDADTIAALVRAVIPARRA